MPAGAGAAGETRVNPGPEAPNAQARGTRGRGSRGVCPGASVPGIQLTRGRSAASRLRAGPLRRVGQEPRGRTRARAQVASGCASHGLLTPGREPVTAGRRRGGAGQQSHVAGSAHPPLLKAPPRGWARPRPALGLSSGDQLATHRHGDSAGTTAGPVTKETFQVQSWGRMPGAGGPPAEARPRGQAAHRAQGDAGVLARVLVSVRAPRA